MRGWGLGTRLPYRERGRGRGRGRGGRERGEGKGRRGVMKVAHMRMYRSVAKERTPPTFDPISCKGSKFVRMERAPCGYWSAHVEFEKHI